LAKPEARVRRLVTLGLVAAATVVIVVSWFLLQRPGAAFDAFKSEAKALALAARPHSANAQAFRATVCAPTSCLLVEAGGLAFVFGAGNGAAQGLASLGLMRGDLDGVVLGDLELASVSGLAELRQASFAAGRTEQLAVFGPEGVVPVVDGVNLALAAGGPAPAAAKLVAGAEGEDQGLSGKVVFDSGVVTIRAFQASAGGRLYRVDFSGKSLIVAGCSARPEDVAGAARGAKQAAVVVAVASELMRKAEREAARTAGLAAPDEGRCMSPEDAARTILAGKLSAGLMAPMYPSIADPTAKRVWKEIVAAPKGAKLAPGGPGAVLDLSRAEPAITLPD
jgi:predicted transcriptional regulator